MQSRFFRVSRWPGGLRSGIMPSGRRVPSPRFLPPSNTPLAMKTYLHPLAVALAPSFLTLAGIPIHAALPVVEAVEVQPLAAQAQRVAQALELLGRPLPEAELRSLEDAARQPNESEAVRAIQEILDPHCLVGVHINPESRVKAAAGVAKPELTETGWSVFLVKVHNEAGVTAPLRAQSPNAIRHAGSDPEQIRDRWLDLDTFDERPLQPGLSGLAVEYRILELYSRDSGRREAKLLFDVGQGTQDLGFRNEIDLLFDSRPAHEVRLSVIDEHGQPATAAFEIRDALGRVYPAQSKRLPPDFHFHPQIYRSHGESVRLPTGSYTFAVSRGPESLPESRAVHIDESNSALEFALRRWIDPAARGWWSGDHHIHAAGCAHFTKPSEGVHAADMIRHCLGEDLKIGANLTWGPCFDYQKQFFTGLDDKVSVHPYLLRYDVEVSGFGSHQSGHLCLLRLKEQVYPGGDSMHHWPTLCLNTLRWAQKQGAVAGPAHSGWGLEVESDELPNYIVPPFSGIGANEYIVDVTHEVPGPGDSIVPAVDFISTVDTPYVWELNIWYHTLNCGFRTRISGETDFPCIYGERVGLGRSYVKLDGPLTYDDWCEGISAGRNYVGDGRSHLLDLRAGDAAMGVNGSELRLAAPSTISVSLDAAALLDEESRPGLRDRPYQQQPYWHVERSRIGDSRKVPVEIIVNGYPKARREIEADGSIQTLTFDIPIERSSWVAARILPSSHTNPVFVLVGNEPVRASRRSAEWCLQGVDQCWQEKERFIAANEIEDARAAYEHARQVYRAILAESEVE